MTYAFAYYDQQKCRIYYSVNGVYCFIESHEDSFWPCSNEELMKIVEKCHIDSHEIVSCDNMSNNDPDDILEICQGQILNSINKPKLK